MPSDKPTKTFHIAYFDYDGKVAVTAFEAESYTKQIKFRGERRSGVPHIHRAVVRREEFENFNISEDPILALDLLLTKKKHESASLVKQQTRVSKEIEQIHTKMKEIGS